MASIFDDKMVATDEWFTSESVTTPLERGETRDQHV